MVDEAGYSVRSRLEVLKGAADRSAREIHVSAHAPIRRYFSAASSMLRQGRTYLLDGALEQAFVLLYRFNIFFLEVLPAHPDFPKKDVAVERKRLKSECMAVLEQVAEIKEILLAQYAADEARQHALKQAKPGAESNEPGAACASFEDEEERALVARLAALRGESNPPVAAPSDPDSSQGPIRIPPQPDTTRRVDAQQTLPGLPTYDNTALREPLFPTRRAEAPAQVAFQAHPRSQPYISTRTSLHAHPLQAVPPIAPPRLIGLHPGASVSRCGLPAQSSAHANPVRADYCTPAVPTMPTAVENASHVLEETDTLLNLMRSCSSLPETRGSGRHRAQPRRAANAPVANVLATLNSQPVSFHDASLNAFPASAAQAPPNAHQSLSELAPAWQRGMLDVPLTRAHGHGDGVPHAGEYSAAGRDKAASSVPGAFAQTGALQCGCVESSGDGRRGAVALASPSAVGAAYASSLVQPGVSRQSSTAAGIAMLSSGRLRPLHLPESLSRTFLDVARANTARNIETCGILLGTLIKGALIVEVLLVPSQTGSSDTCTTTNEDEIWEYCDTNDMMTLGWVHTHPSQTCFLSSVDLHTHCGYQSTLDEAVAVVLSPSHSPSVGVFRLCHPNPPGLIEVQKCRKTGFHPDHQRNGVNAGNGVYENCGHVCWDSSRALRVIDLRR